MLFAGMIYYLIHLLILQNKTVPHQTSRLVEKPTNLCQECLCCFIKLEWIPIHHGFHNWSVKNGGSNHLTEKAEVTCVYTERFMKAQSNLALLKVLEMPKPSDIIQGNLVEALTILFSNLK